MAEVRIALKLGTLLAVDAIMLVEESYAGLKWIERTLEYMGNARAEDIVEVIRIKDERDGPLGVAVRDKDLPFWVLFTGVIANGIRNEEFETLAGKLNGAREREVQVKREHFLEGVIDFYSRGLVNRVFCDCDVQEESFYPGDRIAALEGVLSEFLTDSGIEAGGARKALEIGCGNGGATMALHELGIFPLTIDVNPCEICKGLEEGVLKPEKTIVLDCSLLPSFFGKEFDVVFGFMVGKLTPFERFSWEKVLKAVPKVLKSNGKVFFTVSSEEEAGILNEILQAEFEGVIKKNEASKGYFDEWLYIGELKD